MRRQAHVKPLSDFVDELRAQHPDYQLPDFDPCDGGIEARALLLLEAPGPKAIASGFVSRNNPDPTARNLCELLAEAGIARRDTVIWNIVPWYVGEEARIRAVVSDDLRESAPQLQPLLALLPKLKHVVLVGKKAQTARSVIACLTPATIWETHHFSAQVFNLAPHRKDEVRTVLKQLATGLDTPSEK